MQTGSFYLIRTLTRTKPGLYLYVGSRPHGKFDLFFYTHPILTTDVTIAIDIKEFQLSYARRWEIYSSLLWHACSIPLVREGWSGVGVHYLSSSGCTATAVSPSMVSKRVVATTISSPSAPPTTYGQHCIVEYDNIEPLQDRSLSNPCHLVSE